ncbi:isochorismatase family protein [Mycobacterium camsae]|uniref:isochorismatase family protein n=1 Tax=Mycobacterium gordonae TaxID=1778 RepID=UPI00197CC8CC|nr:isochorismatase family protein [Mycobacterium gordonae]
MRALIIVDVQKDFCEGGALPVPGARAVSRSISDYLAGDPGSAGVEFASELDTEPIEAVFRKGAYGAGYSGFEGVDENGMSLSDWLRQQGVDAVDVAGLATDHCVRRTAHDAARAGLVPRVLLDLTAGVSAAAIDHMLHKTRNANIELIGKHP